MDLNDTYNCIHTIVLFFSEFTQFISVVCVCVCVCILVIYVYVYPHYGPSCLIGRIGHESLMKALSLSLSVV